jgi:hypothetical protein
MRRLSGPARGQLGGAGKGRPDRYRERVIGMAQCEVCGNEYDKAFNISMSGGDSHTFDSFECAIHALAPVCEYCGVKVIGHGVEADGHFYCCAHCASMAGAQGVADRA